MKKLLFIFLACPVFLLSQISDQTAQSMGLIKIQPVQRNSLDKDTVKFVGYDSTSILDETKKRLIFWVRFYNKDGEILEQRQINVTAATLFSYTWTTYVIAKKTFILTKFGLTEVGY